MFCNLHFTVNKPFYSEHVRSFDPRCWGGQTLLKDTIDLCELPFLAQGAFLARIPCPQPQHKIKHAKAMISVRLMASSSELMFPVIFLRVSNKHCQWHSKRAVWGIAHDKSSILSLFKFSQDMQVSWNGGTPSHHRFCTRIFHEINFI